MKFSAPESLRIRKQWLLWKYEQKEGEAKPRKVPYYANGKKRFGTQGDDQDRAQLVDHAAALKAIEKGQYQGLGFAFLPNDGLIGIDLDKMRDAQTGELNERAAKIMQACGSYTEVSPSGTGIHIIVEGTTETNRDVGSGIEVFCGRQFFCWTGEQISPANDVLPIKEPVLAKLHSTIDHERKQRLDAQTANDNRKPAPKPREYNPPSNDNDPQRTYELALKALACISPDLEYDDWLKVGMALQGEFADDGLEMWDDWSKGGSKYGGRRDLEIHWRSFRGDGRKIGSLFFIAQQHGFEFPKRERPAPPAPQRSTPPIKTLPESSPEHELEQEDDHSAGEPGETDYARYFFSQKVRPLGYVREKLFFWFDAVKQIRSFGHNQLKEEYLSEFAEEHEWITAIDTQGIMGAKLDWKAARQVLSRRCHAKGIFDSKLIRGRGCWIDDGRTILHLGDRIIHGSKQYKIGDFKSRYIYEFTEHMAGPGSEEITQDELAHLDFLVHSFRWEMDASAMLLAGWTVLAPVCGALRWRPHIWLSGGSGSGKTTILNDFIQPLMAGIHLPANGESTEAGIRQKLRSDALPVIFDEAEQNQDRDRTRMQHVLSLARQASSDGAAKTLKGSVSGDAMEYHTRSMFAWAAIQVGLKMQADETRVVVLNLRSMSKETEGQGRNPAQEWKTLQKALLRVTQDDLGRKLMVRTMRLMPMIHEAIDVFKTVCAEKHGTQRLGDTYGTLIAGYWAMNFDVAPTYEQARELVDQYTWEAYTDEAHEDESIKALHSILQVQVRYRTTSGGVENTRQIVEIIRDVYTVLKNYENKDNVKEEIDALQRYGVMVARNHHVKDQHCGDCILVANNSDLLAKALEKYPWGTKWHSYLKRIKGAVPTDGKYFLGIKQRCIAIPIDDVLTFD